MQTSPITANAIQYGNNPKAGHYANTGDAPIYYEVYGKGTPLVILHGGMVGSSFEMRQLIDSFSKRFQVIAISTRGHGKSSMGTLPHTYDQKAKDVIAVLNQVTKDSVTVFGFSDGGLTGYFLASMYPQRVKQMIVIGAAETHVNDYKLNVKVSDMMQLDKAYWEQQLALMPEPDRLQELFTAVGNASGKLEISDSFFSTIKCPVLVMAGNHDQFLTTQRVVNASKMIPRAELAIIPNSTHAAFLENFPAVWTATNAFLTRASSVNNTNKKETAMSSTVEQVLMHHLMAFGNNNLEEILKDYSEASVVMTPGGEIKGLSNIRKFFEDFFAVIPTGSAFGMKQKSIVGNVAYIAWDSESATTKIPMGTDTFVFDGDKIKYHTVADYRIKK